ncbi:hypothetical protein WD019_17705 [Fictibacillus sp. Mic-4]|uniref:hypothetical protein n=1 Tax=Fictibacillus TaxID=1329200 RepID=UPI00068909FB|nr:hypothetical protein [Fictibacillus gelatini]
MIQEEFPEGPVGSPVNMKLGKSTPWEGNERHYTPFNYEYKNLHEGLERQMPGAHVTHDDPDTHVQEPYDDYPNP